ncbi:MAG: glycosyl hydrolase family 28-related protein [Planctomycetota bacterium]
MNHTPLSIVRVAVSIAACLSLFVSGVSASEDYDIVFPADSGAIDVTKAPYNAKGDGVTDDTAAINAALADHNFGTTLERSMAATIYLPAGTYLVSDTLAAKLERSGDHPLNAIRIVGHGKDKTTIKLKDRSPGFTNPGVWKPVIRTGYAAIGSRVGQQTSSMQGNSGYSNYVEHLTIDIGRGNFGAGGIHYDVANVGQMQDVRIISSDPMQRGSYGLGIFTTSGIGYVKNVEIVGFDVGIRVENTVNNMVFENIRLTDQRVYGIYNEGKLLSFVDLTSRNAPILLSTLRPQAATFFIGLDAEGPGTGNAISMRDRSFLYIRDGDITGYTGGLWVRRGGTPTELPVGSIDEWWSHTTPASDGATSLRLPIQPTPEFYESDLSKWVNVTDFGVTPNDPTDDDAPGIQAAFDYAGASDDKTTVYFPFGLYHIGEEVVVGDGVRKVDFMHSVVYVSDSAQAQVRVRQSEGQTVNLDNLNRHVPIVHDSDGVLAIRNHKGNHSGRFTTSERATGDLFIENVGPHARTMIQGGINAWVRAVNREKSELINDGSTVWFYGDNIETMVRKTGDPERARRIAPIMTRNGGVTEYLAGCMDPLNFTHVMQDGALFVTMDSTLSANAAGEVRRARGGGDARWPFVARAVMDRETTRVLREDVLYLHDSEQPYPQRWVLPMYRVGPEASDAAAAQAGGR